MHEAELSISHSKGSPYWYNAPAHKFAVFHIKQKSAICEREGYKMDAIHYSVGSARHGVALATHPGKLTQTNNPSGANYAFDFRNG